MNRVKCVCGAELVVSDVVSDGVVVSQDGNDARTKYVCKTCGRDNYNMFKTATGSYLAPKRPDAIWYTPDPDEE